MYCSEFESRQWLLFAPAHNCFGTLCNSLLCPSDTLQSLYRPAEHGTQARDMTVIWLRVLWCVMIHLIIGGRSHALVPYYPALAAPLRV